jgi:hypothetical protein
MHKGMRKVKGTGAMGKAIVMGLLERHGEGRTHSRVRATVLATRRKREMHDEVRKHVAPGTAIYTDELPSYNDLNPDYEHKVVNHAETYVREHVIHTNGMENFWSLLKRSIKGTYINVMPFHLFRYLDEQSFRFNERRDPDGDGGRFVTALGGLVGRRLTYKKLIDAEQPA